MKEEKQPLNTIKPPCSLNAFKELQPEDCYAPPSLFDKDRAREIFESIFMQVTLGEEWDNEVVMLPWDLSFSGENYSLATSQEVLQNKIKEIERRLDEVQLTINKYREEGRTAGVAPHIIMNNMYCHFIAVLKAISTKKQNMGIA